MSVRHAGVYDIHIIKDGEFFAPVEMIVHTGGAEATEAAKERWGQPTFTIDVNFFALKTADAITLVDTGIGPSWGPTFGLGRAALLEAGISPGDVNTILLTHLHTDHMLGLFQDGAAYFPNAEILVPALDLAYFTNAEARDATPEERRDAFNATAQMLAVYGDKVKSFEPGTVMPGIEALALPGHTPGHSGFLVGNSVLLWADTVHIGALQPSDPDIGLIFDLDGKQGAATRHATLARAVAENWVVAGAHITGFNQVEPGYKLVEVKEESSFL